MVCLNTEALQLMETSSACTGKMVDMAQFLLSRLDVPLKINVADSELLSSAHISEGLEGDDVTFLVCSRDGRGTIVIEKRRERENAGSNHIIVVPVTKAIILFAQNHLIETTFRKANLRTKALGHCLIKDQIDQMVSVESSQNCRSIFGLPCEEKFLEMRKSTGIVDNFSAVYSSSKDCN